MIKRAKKDSNNVKVPACFFFRPTTNQLLTEASQKLQESKSMIAERGVLKEIKKALRGRKG